MGIGSLLLRVEPKSLLFLFSLPARLHLHLHLGITFFNSSSLVSNASAYLHYETVLGHCASAAVLHRCHCFPCRSSLRSD